MQLTDAEEQERQRFEGLVEQAAAAVTKLLGGYDEDLHAIILRRVREQRELSWLASRGRLATERWPGQFPARPKASPASLQEGDASTGSEKYSTTRQVADRLHVSIDAVKKWLSQGKLPRTKAGAKTLISENHLQDFLRRSTTNFQPTDAGSADGSES